MPKQTFFNLPDDKRQMILDLAIDEFAEHSYKDASISKIVKKASIAKGSFYQYFNDKQDLYLYLVELYMAQKADYFARFTPPENLGTFDFLRWMFSIRIQFEVVQPKLNRIAYKAISDESQMLHDVRLKGAEYADAITQDILARGQAEGDLDPDLDTELAAFIFNSIFVRLGDFMLQQLNIKPKDLEQDRPYLFESSEAKAVFAGIMQILEQGMGKKL
ncbi:MAG: TetR/AcrR family transcriptional regulator [Chloroflexi bacterium]|nr:TetR/AcrR family transcriptional regulator [Chloroflexota bacterium]